MEPMSPKRGLKIGLIASGALALMILAGVIIVGIQSYDGYCVSFEPPKRPCGLLHFLMPYLLFLIVFSVIGRPVLAIMFLLIVAALPIAGYLLGRRRSGSSSP
jgi:hypothetical protein